MEKTNKAFAYRVPIGDYNYLQCIIHDNSIWQDLQIHSLELKHPIKPFEVIQNPF